MSPFTSQNGSAPRKPRSGLSTPPVPRISGSSATVTFAVPRRLNTYSRIFSACQWAFTAISSTPQLSSMRMMRSSIGTPHIGRSGLGSTSVSGRRRVPNPAASTTAFLTSRAFMRASRS